MNPGLSQSFRKTHVPVPRWADCLREVNCAVKLKKPLVLVHELDKSKGGEDLEKLKSECPEHAREYVFKHHVITWSRFIDYQTQALKEIATGMLLGSPLYRDTPSLELYVPGEVLRKPLHFKSRVGLYCSNYNEGAIAVAFDMNDRYPDVVPVTTLPEVLERLRKEGPDKLAQRRASIFQTNFCLA